MIHVRERMRKLGRFHCGIFGWMIYPAEESHVLPTNPFLPLKEGIEDK